MLSQLRQSKIKGFTIIEVLIVLAIAGLILLVVFLAVPSVQRTARNTERTTDAGNILSSMSEYVGNNGGRLPDEVGPGDNESELMVGAASSNQIPVNLGYYQASDVGIGTYPSVAANDTNEDTIMILKSAKCNTNDIGEPEDGPTRSVVILYTLENESKQCRAS